MKDIRIQEDYRALEYLTLHLSMKQIGKNELSLLTAKRLNIETYAIDHA